MIVNVTSDREVGNVIENLFMCLFAYLFIYLFILFSDYQCINVIVNVTSNREVGNVIESGELIMSEREYIIDHTHPWVKYKY